MNKVTSTEQFIPKDIALSIVHKILDVMDDLPPPQKSELLQRQLDRFDEPYPDHIQQMLQDFYNEEDEYKINIAQKCEKDLPEGEFERLNSRYPGIIQMIFRLHRNTNIQMMDHLLGQAEMVQSGQLSDSQTGYKVVSQLRNQFVLPKLNMKPEDVDEMNPDTVDMDKIKKENPQYFQ